MSEKDLAAELQASKGDPGEWEAPEEAPEPVQRKQRLQAMVSVRFAPDELERIQRYAQERGQTVSAYIRALAIRDLEGRPQGVATFGVSISSAGTYSAHVGNPSVMSDGRRLTTTAG
ncbi:MAG: plasmid mobilization protein [Actinomycetes bacterium]